MNLDPGEDLVAFKQRVDELQLKLARRAATMFAATAVVALVALVFGFFQKEATDKYKFQSEQCAAEAIEYKERAEVAEERVNQMNAALNKALKDAEEVQRKAEDKFKRVIANERRGRKN